MAESTSDCVHVWSDDSLAAPLCFNYSISRGQRKPLTVGSGGRPYCSLQIQYRCGGLMPLTVEHDVAAADPPLARVL
jgi:hypothetical protein